jgi:hypothetical protein
MAHENLTDVMTPAPLIIQGTLDPYAGPFTRHQAKHLLRRAMFGPTIQQIDQAANEGLEATLDRLLADQPAPQLPINYDNNNDPNVPIGESWVYAPIVPMLNYSQRSLRAWQVGLFLNEGVSLREKMVLFWHNHFVVADAPHAKFLYQYVELLRNQALGNFRQLAKDVTVNSMMLLYLNGAQNNKNAPNENYARELLELFTIGKGPQAGPGDYTHYTEEDIKEIARALTGWTVDFAGFNAAGPHPAAIFRPNRHDTGTKQLSHRFNNTVINNENENEYKRVVDIILAQEETARFIARKLYRWFVYYYIDEAIEANVIEPLAAILRDNDYDIKPALRALLSSDHFYQENAIGCQIKSPVDFTANVAKSLGIQYPASINLQYVIWQNLHALNATLQQDMFAPPSVAGWKAYYQEPVFYRNWISSVTLPVRSLLLNAVASGQFVVFGQRLGVDVLGIVANIPDAEYPDQMIRGLCEIYLPYPLTDEQYAYLKENLIPGLPDFEWTVEYGLYLNEPDNATYKTAVENRLRALFIALLNLPEYQLQ